MTGPTPDLHAAFEQVTGVPVDPDKRMWTAVDEHMDQPTPHIDAPHDWQQGQDEYERWLDRIGGAA